MSRQNRGGRLVKEYAPYAAIALAAGLANLLNASAQLKSDCRFLVFYRPFRVPAVYFWALAQLAIPAAVVWLSFDYTGRPTIGMAMVGKAIALGAGFVVVMNSTTQVGGRDITWLRRVYDWAVSRAKDAIAARETARTAAFWESLIAELSTVTSLAGGLNYLRFYVEHDIALSTEVRTATLAKVDEVAKLPDRDGQLAAVKALLAVRRRDLPLVLQKFGCSSAVVSSLVA